MSTKHFDEKYDGEKSGISLPEPARGTVLQRKTAEKLTDEILERLTQIERTLENMTEQLDCAYINCQKES